MAKSKHSHLALSVAATFFPQVVLNAFLAAFTAASTSSFVASEKSKRCSAVAGLTVEKVALEEEGTNSLLLWVGKSWREDSWTGEVDNSQ